MKRNGRKGQWTAAVLLCCMLTGCAASHTQEKARSPAGYSVIPVREIPPELAEIIEENKKGEIRLTYEDGGMLYLVRGYGEQKTGGYSIAVQECTQDEERIWLDTRLIGPQTQELPREEPSYPYLVIRMEAGEKEIMIQ